MEPISFHALPAVTEPGYSGLTFDLHPLTQAIHHPFILHRPAQIFTGDTHLRMLRRIADHSQRPTSREHMVNERVSPVVEGKPSDSIGDG